ncbi:E3 ubiquitin-protein like [Actinidia chinensis var. chinensis]|uniref:RING-type E3 ubiquitin transferase n=1 Tax=Actinidia chinensis var. chinensis TaxID=1590841 RepID=A0A2R6RV61_ACTCC|nr:E3 ubiquitin-protein like [Actinidia chinensis var. chinensis]
MGISWSSNNNNRRRRNNNYLQNPHHPPSQLIASSSSSYPSEPYPAPSSFPYPAHRPPPPPPPPPPIYYYSGGYNACNYPNHMAGRGNFAPYGPYQNNGWALIRPPQPQPLPQPQQPPPPYVHHQQAKKVRNDVNVHKDTLRLEVDEQNPDHHLVSFVFDALFDGSFTILYFAKEEPNCRFVPLFPEEYIPAKVPFQKGIGQKFCQPSGTGIDLGFFELDELSRPSSGEDVFPLVISAETFSPSVTAEEQLGDPPPSSSSSPHMQITQAVIQKNNDNTFQMRVIRQILWIDEVRYELREIYGIGNSSAESFKDDDPGKECVICMTEPKDTAVLPCRHMCMCSECAKALRLQSNKCPICRQPFEELIEIKIDRADQ